MDKVIRATTEKFMRVTSLALTIIIIVLMILPVTAYAENSAASNADTSSVSGDNSSVIDDTIPPETSDSVIVVQNLETNTVIFTSDDNALTKNVAPGSVAKLMTAMLVYDKLATLETKIKIPQESANEDFIGGLIPSAPRLGLSVGGEYTARTLLNLLLVSGANDVCVALACHVSNGDLAAFVESMNQRATALGAKDTFFTNSTGLDDVDMYTNCADILLIVREFYKYNDLVQMATASSYSNSAEGISRAIKNKNFFTNDNPLYLTIDSQKSFSYKNSSITGICVGQRSEWDDYSLICAYPNGDLTYFIIIMEAPTTTTSGGVTTFPPQNAYSDVKALLPWIKKFGYCSLLSQKDYFLEVPVDYSMKSDFVIAVPERSVEYLAINADLLKSSYTLKPLFDAEEYQAPILKGQRLGVVEIISNGTVVDTVTLIAKESVEESSFLKGFDSLKSILFGSTVRTIIKVLVVGFAIYLIFSFIMFIVRFVHRYKKSLKAITDNKETVEHDEYDYEETDDEDEAAEQELERKRRKTKNKEKSNKTKK